MNEHTVVIENVSHAFGSGDVQTPVLKRLNLTFKPGTFVVLTGPSGSGKTTLLTLIGALRSPQQGRVIVAGKDLRKLDPAGLVEIRRQIGFVFQHHNLLEALTAVQNVQAAAQLTYADPREAEARSMDVLKRVGLAGHTHQKPRELSGGQRQRVAIARALVGAPKLILADEPTAAVDAGMARHVIQLLRQTATERGTTVIVVTHDRRVIESADRLIHLSDGQVVSDLMIQETIEVCMFLKTCDLAADLSPSMLVELSEKIRVVKMPAGSPIVEHGQLVDTLYLIREGTVEVFSGPRDKAVAPTSSPGPGKTFAEGALYSQEPSGVSAAAKTPVTLYTIKGADYIAALDHAMNQRAELMSVFITRGVGGGPA